VIIKQNSLLCNHSFLAVHAFGGITTEHFCVLLTWTPAVMSFHPVSIMESSVCAE